MECLYSNLIHSTHQLAYTFYAIGPIDYTLFQLVLTSDYWMKNTRTGFRGHTITTTFSSGLA